MRCLPFLLAAIIPACGQPFSFGIKVGGAATEGLDANARNQWEGKRYAAGIMAEMKLPFRLAAEVDALYKRAGQRGGDCVFTFCSVSSLRAGVLEVPVLVKYRMARRAAAPFVAGGVSWQWVRHGAGSGLGWRTGPLVSLDEVVDYSIHTNSFATPAEHHVGAVAAAGIEFRAHGLKLAPEFRYTRWNARYWESYGSRGFFTGSNLNQAEVLLGLFF